MRAPLAQIGGRLTRGRVAAAGVGLATLAAVAVLVGVFALGWWRGEGGAYAPRGVAATTRITPSSSLFGDILAARANVLFDPRRVDPASVILEPDFRPYRIRSSSRRVEDGVGRATHVEFQYAIQCLSRWCATLAGRRQQGRAETEGLRLPPARLTGRTREGRPLVLRLAWPELTLHSRLSAEEVALSTPGIEPTFTPPAVSWRISPNLLGGLSLTGAVLLVLGAGWLVASAVLGDARRLRTPKLPAHLTAVERALVLAEHAAERGEVDESRKALERLAVELRRSGVSDLAVRADQLAWSESEPSRAVVEALTVEVRSNGVR